MITEVVNGPGEVFAHYQLVPLVRADRHVGLAENEQQFIERAHALIEREHPGCSDGLKRLVTCAAWDEHARSRVRLEISPAALRLLADLVKAAPASPAAQELSAAVAKAGRRAGWSDEETAAAP